MSYPILIGEMAKEKITIEAVSQVLNKHRNTIAYKLNVGSFDVEEAYCIRDNFFPAWEIEKLFQRGSTSESA